MVTISDFDFDSEEWMSRPEAILKLGFSDKAFRLWQQAGRLKPYYKAQNRVFYRVQDLKNLLAERNRKFVRSLD